jgi:hypothetical protein
LGYPPNTEENGASRAQLTSDAADAHGSPVKKKDYPILAIIPNKIGVLNIFRSLGFDNI